MSCEIFFYDDKGNKLQYNRSDYFDLNSFKRFLNFDALLKLSNYISKKRISKKFIKENFYFNFKELENENEIIKHIKKSMELNCYNYNPYKNTYLFKIFVSDNLDKTIKYEYLKYLNIDFNKLFVGVILVNQNNYYKEGIYQII